MGMPGLDSSPARAGVTESVTHNLSPIERIKRFALADEALY